MNARQRRAAATGHVLDIAAIASRARVMPRFGGVELETAGGDVAPPSVCFPTSVFPLVHSGVPQAYPYVVTLLGADERVLEVHLRRSRASARAVAHSAINVHKGAVAVGVEHRVYQQIQPLLYRYTEKTLEAWSWEAP